MSLNDRRLWFYAATRRIFPRSHMLRVMLFAGLGALAPLAMLGATLAVLDVRAAPALALLGVTAASAVIALAALAHLLRPVAAIAAALDGFSAQGGQGDEIARITGGVRGLERRIETLARRGDPAQLDDPLTGLPNRLSVMRRGRDEITRARRKGSGLSVALVEIDDFSLAAAALGPEDIDRALRLVAEAMVQALRAYDVVGRWEGPMFVAVLPEAEVEHAVNAMHRVRNLLAVEEIGRVGETPLTVSAGIAVLHPEDATLADIAARAGAALGRARVRYGSGVEAAPGPRTRPAQITTV
jgi:diguanylate cyclase (GGDEF)-like protein